MGLELDSAEYIKKFEGYKSNAYWDVNAWRIGYGSDTTELSNGSYRNVVQGDKTNVDLATKDLSRRIRDEFLPRVRAKIGEPYWSNLPEQAQMALLSLAYNYGNITHQAIVEAARTGNLATLSQAIVSSTYNDNSALPQSEINELRQRRLAESQMVTSAGSYVGQGTKVATEFVEKNKWPLITVAAGLTGLIITGVIWSIKSAKN